MPVQWTSPIGLPCMQPYKAENFRYVRKVKVPSYRLTIERINKRKQANAFPPNFVHSLDASHMMFTASKCVSEGIHFVGVHDSYWCHNCDVDRMNEILKEQVIM